MLVPLQSQGKKISHRKTEEVFFPELNDPARPTADWASGAWQIDRRGESAGFLAIGGDELAGVSTTAGSS